MFGKILILVTAAAVAVGTVARTSHGASPERGYTVKAGDTLWAIAERHYDGDPRASVWELQRRNDLAGADLVPGQKLVLP